MTAAKVVDCKDCKHIGVSFLLEPCVDCIGDKYEKRIEPTGIEALVCQDISDRQVLGLAKYKTTLADNPLELKEWLVHQYQELLDAALYCKRAIVQIEKTEELKK